ncbi:hypothetical protein ILUMI_26122 [Ignelater luminosus]|uniref:Uncharacterized protein n=1 Tax=Ignelater luminosus TaxID=2038154 RepID=A0A8K0C8L1_IGNLU|nr:hypothetical protein ILUMI_26122 [Ignelater luminosus]
MSKTLQRRKSSTSSRKRQSFERRSQADSLKEETDSLVDEASRDDSVLVTLDEGKSKINYQDELVLIFFNSMLDNIIDEWVTVPDEIPPPCVCKTDEQEDTLTKDFKHVTQDDLLSMEIANIEGSTLSLTKKRKLKKSSSHTRSSIQQSKSREKYDLTSKKRHSKSNEQVNDQHSKLSIKRSSKDIPERRSRASSATVTTPIPSSHSLDWLLNPPDENVIIRFKNGNRYKGPVSRKLMHGQGKFFWADGAIYEGEFVYGDATGKGTLEYPELTSYSGYFCKSFLHGKGVLNISSSTMIYSGNWKAGQKHGKGWVLYEPGDWYEGEWYEDKRHGRGFRQYLSGERYQGQWQNGKKHGQGTFIWNNNDLYKGEWLKGIMNGYGEYTWDAFLNETFTFPLENTYRGTWIDGMRHGVGIMTFGIEGGAKLVGMWKRDKKHGAGVIVCGNGTMIERNPLFWDDKPIHLETEFNRGYPSATSNDSVRSPDLFKSISVDANNTTDNADKMTLQLIAKEMHSRCAIEKCSCEVLVCKTCQLKKSYEWLKESVQSIAVKSRPDFPTGKTECSPLPIPIHLAPESIDFSYYTNLAVEKYTAQLYKSEVTIMDEKETEDCQICGGIRSSEAFPSTVSKYSKWNILTHTNDLSKSKMLQNSKNNVTQSNSEVESRIASYQQIQIQVEEKHLRNTIIAHLPNLRKIYHKYATIASPYLISFRPVLIRLFLWQMLRDLNILDRKYSLIDMDMILMDNPGCGLETDHNPFDKIYFWQYLQILLMLTWVLHSPSDVTEECKQFGILSTLFVKFLTETVYRNVAVSSACSIFEYRDIVPINSVYSLYRSIGEPHTARQLLCKICTKKKEDPPCYLKIFEDEKTPKLVKGVNAVPFGGNIVFLPDDPADIGEKPDDVTESDQSIKDPYRKQLYALRSLGPKRVIECLTNICPQIACDNQIINMDYPLSFIEFYETLLMCAFMMVDKMKKREEKIKMKEERIRLSEALELGEENDTSSKGI